MKIKWYDWLIYRLYHWRWQKILAARPDMREMMINWMKAFDTLDEGEKVKVTVTIEKSN